MEFDVETAQILERCYLGADITQRRRFSFDALHPAPGETLLDIGCGNALLTVELARATGDAGRVVGVDPSQAMCDAARARCRDISWIDIKEGNAVDLPVESNSIDKAVSLQVFEYLDDIPSALAEAYRVLRNPGVLAVGDMHFDSWIWYSDDPDRMNRVISAWDKHLVERCVPSTLSPMMRDVGFRVEDIRAHTFCDYQLKPDGLAAMLLVLMERFCRDRSLISIDELREWRDEQYALAKAGRFFFSLTHYVVIATKASA